MVKKKQDREGTTNRRIDTWANQNFCPACTGLKYVRDATGKFTEVCPACGGSGMRKGTERSA